jgi:hypothetical protein
VHRLAENIYRRMVFCRTEEGVSVVSGSKVSVIFVKLESEGEKRYVFCTDLQICL